MKYIVDGPCFDSINKLIGGIIKKGERFPKRVFSRNYRGWLFIAFDLIFTTEFFSRTKMFLTKSGEQMFLLSVVDPDPSEYFCRYFGYFGTIEFATEDSEKDYLNSLNADPGGSPADALIHNSNVLIIMSENGKWAIIGDRDADIGICAFLNNDEREAFLSVYGPLLLPNIEAAINLSKVMNENREEFMKNFGATTTADT